MEIANRLCHKQNMTGLVWAPFVNPDLSFHLQRSERDTSLSRRKIAQAMRCCAVLGLCGMTKVLGVEGWVMMELGNDGLHQHS